MKKYKYQQSNCKSSPISNKLLQGLVSHKLTAYLSVFNLILTQWNMAILSKGCKPENFNPHNSLKLSFTNIWGFRSSFVECESFLGSNSHSCSMWDKLGWLSWFGQFLCDGLSSFNPKRFYYSYALSCMSMKINVNQFKYILLNTGSHVVIL